MKYLLLIALLFIACSKETEQPKTTFIGNQEWTTENLKVDRLNDGTKIEYYELKEYGYYYHIQDVLSGQLCPDGFRVPALEDYEQLIDYLGEDAAKMLKSVNWQGSNETGFNALPGGFIRDGTHTQSDTIALFRTQTDNNEGMIYAFIIYDDYIWRVLSGENEKLNVRCVK
jgi:uncharacterized protein (TIGR02145 family)